MATQGRETVTPTLPARLLPAAGHSPGRSERIVGLGSASTTTKQSSQSLTISMLCRGSVYPTSGGAGRAFPLLRRLPECDLEARPRAGLTAPDLRLLTASEQCNYCHFSALSYCLWFLGIGLEYFSLGDSYCHHPLQQSSPIVLWPPQPPSSLLFKKIRQP